MKSLYSSHQESSLQTKSTLFFWAVLCSIIILLPSCQNVVIVTPDGGIDSGSEHEAPIEAGNLKETIADSSEKPSPLPEETPITTEPTVPDQVPNDTPKPADNPGPPEPVVPEPPPIEPEPKSDLAGFTVSLKLSKILKPKALSALMSGIPNVPYLLTFISERNKILNFVYSSGKAPSGGQPFKGKDELDLKEPFSSLLQGTKNGNQLVLKSKRFPFGSSGVNFRLTSFELKGTLSNDKKGLTQVSFKGVGHAKQIEKEFGLQICALIRGECYKNAQGEDVFDLHVSLESFENSLDFTVMLTSLYHKQQDVPANTKIEFYANQPIVKGSVTVQLESCKNSQRPVHPCDASAVLTKENKAGSILTGPYGRHGSLQLSKLTSQTWYKLSIVASNGKKYFRTFTTFRTK